MKKQEKIICVIFIAVVGLYFSFGFVRTKYHYYFPQKKVVELRYSDEYVSFGIDKVGVKGKNLILHCSLKNVHQGIILSNWEYYCQQNRKRVHQILVIDQFNNQFFSEIFEGSNGKDLYPQKKHVFTITLPFLFPESANQFHFEGYLEYLPQKGLNGKRVFISIQFNKSVFTSID